MTILDRYFAKTVLLHTLMVMAVLLALMTLVTFIGQQDDIGQGSYRRHRAHSSSRCCSCRSRPTSCCRSAR